MTLLHERWFVDSTPYPLAWSSVTRPGALIAVGAAVAALLLAAFVWRRSGHRPLVPVNDPRLAESLAFENV